MRITVEGVEREYRSGGRVLPVLRGIDLEVPSERMAAIVGPSGSGKTTLLGLMAGLDRPTAGRIHLGDTEITSSTEEARARFRARHIGFVFQDFHLLPALTARQNVQVPMEIHPDREARAMGRIRERALELLDRVGLADRADHHPAQLSGGEKQRVALARAFSIGPRLLFADEPTGNLDRRTGERVIDLLQALNRESGTTLVLVTHDSELADRADLHFRMDDGRIRREDGAG